MSSNSPDGTVPKAEMHLHLEGAARPRIARRMAEKYGASIEDIVARDGETYVWEDFSGFLQAYDRVASLFRTAEDYAELTDAYLDELARAGTIYAELIVWPDHPSRPGPPAEEYLAGIREGIASHDDAFGSAAVTVRLCVTGVRHDGAESVEHAARFAAMRADDPLVVGFGMAGDERSGAPADFARAFDIAREAGLGISCHAGELCGADGVRATMDALRPDRIDHGVRAIEDADLVARIADEGVVLAVSTGSNVSLDVYPSLGAHPLPKLCEAGCRVVLGSDDPPFFGGSIAGEYENAAEVGLDGRMLTSRAIDGAFCDEATREGLRARMG